MDAVAGNPASIETQISLFDAILDLLSLEPVFLLGIIIIAFLLVVLFRKDNRIPRIKTSVVSILLYYYVCLIFVNVVGIPTISEFIRVSQFGESIFNPNINLIPLSDGLGTGFVLNIVLFLPLGFLCPMVSKTYGRIKNTLLAGAGLSLFIEISQLFTLYRATDITDVLTNTLGTLIGYLCYRLIVKPGFVKPCAKQKSAGKDFSSCLPIVIIAVAFILGFISQ